MSEMLKLKTKRIVVRNLFRRTAKYVDIFQNVPLKRIKSVLEQELGSADFQMEVIEKTKANCFKVTLGNDEYFVKVFTRHDPYMMKRLMGAIYDRKYLKVKKDVYIAMEKYYDGKTLDTYDDKTLKNLNAGKQIADDLKALHKIEVDKKPLYILRFKHAMQCLEKQNYKDLDKIVNFIKSNNVEFKPVLIHGDLFPSNVYIGEGGVVTVIDYESAQAGHPYEDFSYLMLYSDEYPVFVKELLNAYFDGKLPENFWKENAYFTAIRYIVNLSETYKNLTREQVDENTEHIIKEFLESEHPSWWK